MNDRVLIEALNDAVEDVLSGAGPVSAPAGTDLASLVSLAVELRNLPRENFQARLKEELMTSTAAPRPRSETAPFAREGFSAVTPYLVSSNRATRLVDFVTEAFGGEPLVRSTGSLGGIHAELRVGDSILMIGGDAPAGVSDAPNALHLYVPDADATYARALAAGAESLKAPVDQPYGDREAGVRDPAGNVWWIATHQAAASYRPEGLHSVTAFLHPKGAARLIAFLDVAFGAEEIERTQSPDGVVRHATVRIGDGAIEMGEAHGEFQPLRSQFYLYVPDCDATHARAIAAGAISISKPADQPYGDRSGAVEDPFGNTWYIATHLSR